MSLVFYMKGKTESSVEYVDKLPEGMTAQEFKKQYGLVVWCDYFGCKYNAQVADTQRTTGKLLNKRGYQPLGQDAGVWRCYGIKEEEGRRITGGSNAGYKRFLDKLHIPLQKLELDGNSDAESRVVLKLPAITKDLILGKSVVISVAHEEWTGMRGNRNISATGTLVRLRNGSQHEQGDS